MTHDAEFWWNWWVQLGTAVATFAAVVVALFLDWIRSKVFPPLLNVRLVEDAPPPALTGWVVAAGQQPQPSLCRWYHVRAENERRMSRATETQLCVLEYSEANAAGEFVALRWKANMVGKKSSLPSLSTIR